VFEQDSRYYHIEDLTFEDADGNEIVYKARRLIPQPETVHSAVGATVSKGQRLDQISYVTLGRANLYWRIGDANPSFSLHELEEPGTSLRIPVNGGRNG
jgi:hypothetical protein